MWDVAELDAHLEVAITEQRLAGLASTECSIRKITENCLH